MSRPRPTSRRFVLERLEDRSVPSAAPTLSLPSIQVDASRAATDHILVEYKRGQIPAALPGTTIGRSFGLVQGLYQVNLAGATLGQALASYRADARVLVADLDYHITASWNPNDARYRDQYHLKNTGQNKGTVGADIKAPQGWSTITNTTRVPVAVMDSGIDYTHPDLYLNIWINQGEIPASRKVNLKDVDRDGRITFRDLNNPINIGLGKITDLNNNGYIDAGDVLKPMTKDSAGRDTGAGGWADRISNEGDKYVDDLVGWNPTKGTGAGNNDPFDDFGHGTHVAGIIGAVGNNGVGVAGLNWNASLVPVKFLNRFGAGSIGWFIDGLEWALSKGIKISNNSWNDSGYTQILFDAVKIAQGKGHLFVAAAGNNNRNTDTTPAYPAGLALNNVISVGATDRLDRKAGFSNFGAKSVDIFAPGVDILSTNPNKAYGTRSGTSLATPQVTGVIAAVWTLRPEWSYQQVINWVMSTADRLPSLNGLSGSGRLNFAAAVKVPPRGTPQPSGVRAASVMPSEYLSGFVGSGAAAEVAGLLESQRQKSNR